MAEYDMLSGTAFCGKPQSAPKPNPRGEFVEVVLRVPIHGLVGLRTEHATQVARDALMTGFSTLGEFVRFSLENPEAQTELSLHVNNRTRPLDNPWE